MPRRAAEGRVVALAVGTIRFLVRADSVVAVAVARAVVLQVGLPAAALPVLVAGAGVGVVHAAGPALLVSMGVPFPPPLFPLPVPLLPEFLVPFLPEFLGVRSEHQHWLLGTCFLFYQKKRKLLLQLFLRESEVYRIIN